MDEEVIDSLVQYITNEVDCFVCVSTLVKCHIYKLCRISIDSQCDIVCACRDVHVHLECTQVDVCLYSFADINLTCSSSIQSVYFSVFAVITGLLLYHSCFGRNEDVTGNSSLEVFFYIDLEQCAAVVCLADNQILLITRQVCCNTCEFSAFACTLELKVERYYNLRKNFSKLRSLEVDTQIFEDRVQCFIADERSKSTILVCQE